MKIVLLALLNLCNGDVICEKFMGACVRDEGRFSEKTEKEVFSICFERMIIYEEYFKNKDTDER